MNKVYIAITLAVILLLGGYFAYKNTNTQAPQKTNAISKEQVTQKLAIKENGVEQIGFLDFEIIPESTTIRANSTVKWTNYGDKPQIVKGIGFESNVLQKGDSYEHKFQTQGNYTFTSDLRDFAILEGTIIVT